MKDLRASLHDPKTLAQYADELGLSTGHLSRTFATVAGRPFRDEIRRLRMEAALRLLKKPEKKIAAIALELGLRSPSQFVADFRRYHGVSPGKFRRR
jgi:AraC-like DNA-binding protein